MPEPPNSDSSAAPRAPRRPTSRIICRGCGRAISSTSWVCAHCRAVQSENVPAGARVVRIGRESDNDVVIDPDFAEASKYHAEVLVESTGSMRIRDCDSRNGTFVNRRRIHGAVPIVASDDVRLGKARLDLSRVRSGDIGVAPPEASASDRSGRSAPAPKPVASVQPASKPVASVQSAPKPVTVSTPAAAVRKDAEKAEVVTRPVESPVPEPSRVDESPLERARRLVLGDPVALPPRRPVESSLPEVDTDDWEEDSIVDADPEPDTDPEPDRAPESNAGVASAKPGQTTEKGFPKKDVPAEAASKVKAVAREPDAVAEAVRSSTSERAPAKAPEAAELPKRPAPRAWEPEPLPDWSDRTTVEARTRWRSEDSKPSVNLAAELSRGSTKTEAPQGEKPTAQPPPPDRPSPERPTAQEARHESTDPEPSRSLLVPRAKAPVVVEEATPSGDSDSDDSGHEASEHDAPDRHVDNEPSPPASIVVPAAPDAAAPIATPSSETSQTHASPGSERPTRSSLHGLRVGTLTPEGPSERPLSPRLAVSLDVTPTSGGGRDLRAPARVAAVRKNPRKAAASRFIRCECGSVRRAGDVCKNCGEGPSND